MAAATALLALLGLIVVVAAVVHTLWKIMDILASIRRTPKGKAVSVSGTKVKLAKKQDGPLQTIDLDGLSNEELIGVITDMIHDWNVLNDIHNQRANDERWCPTYERNQAKYNTKFRRLRLRGRNGEAQEPDADAGDSFARGERDRHRALYQAYEQDIRRYSLDPARDYRHYGYQYGTNRRVL